MTTNPLRPDKPRIEPVDLDAVDDDVRELLGKTMVRGGKALNIFGTLAHNPGLLKRFNVFAGFFLTRNSVPDRDRELVVLRVGANAGAVYEFGQHTIIGRLAGLTDDEILRLTQPLDDDWSDDDRLLLTMADELCEHDAVSDATWRGLAARWSTAELLELVLLAGTYRLVSGFLNAVGVELDDGVPGWPGADA